MLTQVAAALAMAEARASRWYFGGLASCGAACCTHPLDLLKVSLSFKAERARKPKAPGTVPGLAPTGCLLRPPTAHPVITATLA